MITFFVIWASFCLFVFLFIIGANMKPKENIHQQEVDKTDLPPIPYELYLVNEEFFTCNGCGNNVPSIFQMRTKDYCYLCDPNLTIEELLLENNIYDKEHL